MWCETERIWTGVCVRENESECERAGVSVSRLKWNERKCNQLFYVGYWFQFIAVCIFILPVKAALHHGGFIFIYSLPTKIKWEDAVMRIIR